MILKFYLVQRYFYKNNMIIDLSSLISKEK